MGFKAFLTEGRRKEIDKYEAVELYKKHCKNYKWGAQTIYRGVKGNTNIRVIDPSKHDRVSANTENYYTLWIDNSKKWDKFPKRSKSLICATDVSTATGYGSTYIIIPFDGATLGICPANDMWESFWNELDKINAFALSGLNSFILNMVRALVKPSSGFVEKAQLGKDYKTLVSYLNKADMVWKNHPDKAKKQINDDGWDADEIYDTLKKYGGLVKIMDMILDPKSNKFNVMPFKSFKHENFPMKEVWTDSKCLMIPSAPVTIDDFRNKVEI